MIECAVIVAWLKGPINQLRTVQQSRQQTLIAYCPDLYTVPNMAIKGDDKDPTLAPADAVPENTYVCISLPKKLNGKKITICNKTMSNCPIIFALVSS